MATERDDAERHQWRARISAHRAAQFVVVDECGTHVNLTPRYARAPKGQRAPGPVPRNTPTNTTVLAALTTDGMGATMVLEGATDTAAFRVYVQHFLVPTLRPGHMVVLDHLSAHPHTRVRELIEATGCELWYLPAYAPDLAPSEEALAKLKQLLRHAAARTRAALLAAIERALNQITAAAARGFLQHCGFHQAAVKAQ